MVVSLSDNTVAFLQHLAQWNPDLNQQIVKSSNRQGVDTLNSPAILGKKQQ